jgi:hypothetical protein
MKVQINWSNRGWVDMPSEFTSLEAAQNWVFKTVELARIPKGDFQLRENPVEEKWSMWQTFREPMTVEALYCVLDAIRRKHGDGVLVRYDCVTATLEINRDVNRTA